MPMMLPNTAILTTSAIPISTMATAKTGVAVRRTSSGLGISRSRRRDGLEPPPRHPRRRLDDHAAWALGQHRLHRAVEERAAAAGCEREHDPPRAHLACLVDDHPPGLPGAHLLDVPGPPAPADQ